MAQVAPLVIKRVFSASREELFTLWTDVEGLKRWFAPSDSMTVTVAECDAREGGSYRIVMQNQDGETYSPSGVYEKVVANELLVFSWKWADSALITRVTLEFRDAESGETELTLTHDGFPDDGVRDHHKQGWDGCLRRLAAAVR